MNRQTSLKKVKKKEETKNEETKKGIPKVRIKESLSLQLAV